MGSLVPNHAPVQLKGIQEKWARDPKTWALSLRVEQLAARLADLLHEVTIHLERSDAQYLRGRIKGTPQPRQGRGTL